MSGCLLFVGRARTPGGEQEQREVHADPRGETATREKSRQRAEVSMYVRVYVCVCYTRQTRIKETHCAVRKGFLLSIVSFTSCLINVESLTCIKSEE